MTRVLIFPETKPEAGAGHITRCMALAEQLIERQADVAYFCQSENVQALALLGRSGVRVFERPASRGGNAGLEKIKHLFGSGKKIDWLVVDRYDVDSLWLAQARHFTERLAVIDDLANRFLDCDLLINQNLGFGRLYDDLVPAATRRLIGPGFALLRKEFTLARTKGLRYRDGQIKRILIFMGGADVHDNTGKAVRAAAHLANREIALDVVVGPDYRYMDRLHDGLGSASAIATVHAGATAKQMASLMEAADICIGAAGSASWERCCLGLPAILFIAADNQAPIAERLSSGGAARSLGPDAMINEDAIVGLLTKLIDDPGAVREMSKAAALITDGKGAGRVADEVLRWR